MRVGNEDRSPLRVYGRDAAPTPTGFAEIVSDDFPVLHFRSREIHVFDSRSVIETHETADENSPEPRIPLRLKRLGFLRIFVLDRSLALRLKRVV
jgi:hypothetical protein